LRVWCALALWGLLAAPVPAAQVDYGAGLSMTYESNINRTETNEASELIESAMAGVSLRENNADLNARAIAQFEHRHFTRATNSDDTTGFLDAAAVWTISPQRLVWLFADTFREVQLTLTAPDTPSNRTKSNTLDTGPDLTLAVSAVNSIVLGARFGRFDIQNSNNDSKRYQAVARAIHLLSTQSRISANYEATRVHFEPGAQPFQEILREDLFGRYDYLYAGSGAIIDLGNSRVIRYGGDPLSGRLERIALLRALSVETSVRASYSDEISDTYTDLIRGISLSTAPTDPGPVVLQGTALGTADVYHSQRAELAFLNNSARFPYTLLGYGRKIDFATLDEDYNERGARLGVSWLYSAATRFSVYGDYSRRAYTSFPREDTDRNFNMSADIKPGRSFTVTLLGNILRRDSTVDGVSYLDKRVVLLLGYSTGQQYDIRSRR
jgi:hypothetical protein